MVKSYCLVSVETEIFFLFAALSGVQLLELQLLDMRLVDTFWPFQAVFTFLDNWSNPVDPKD